jgi:hypothetical protein
MEADWEVEIGPGAPVIDVQWSGFVDLRSRPQAARELPEAGDLPELAEALARLNGTASPVWTSKCDVWQILDAESFDVYEMEASPESAQYAWACYIDLLPQSAKRWASPDTAISWCRTVCKQLHEVALRNCRADLVIRNAITSPEFTDMGITAYLTSCGPTRQEAYRVLGSVLLSFADALCHLQR